MSWAWAGLGGWRIVRSIYLCTLIKHRGRHNFSSRIHAIVAITRCRGMEQNCHLLRRPLGRLRNEALCLECASRFRLDGCSCGSSTRLRSACNHGKKARRSLEDSLSQILSIWRCLCKCLSRVVVEDMRSQRGRVCIELHSCRPKRRDIAGLVRDRDKDSETVSAVKQQLPTVNSLTTYYCNH